MVKQMIIFCCCWCCLSVVLQAQQVIKQLVVEVGNQWGKRKSNEPIVLKVNELKTDFPVKSVTVWDGDIELPSQLDDLDGDRKPDELVFVTDVPANSSKTFKLILSAQKMANKYPSKVHAQMLLSDKTKHIPISSISTPTDNMYHKLHHHGPAFESELVAYRLYFDKKQTVDIYGKFNQGLEIEACGFYPNDEQLAARFGDDVLRVGGSCGLGTLKGWDGEKAIHIDPVSNRTERIIAYGPVRTLVEVEVNDWQYQSSELNMINRYILYAGHRDAEVEVIFDKPLVNQLFCTGVQNIKGSASYSDHKGLIAVWGTDWPVNDTVKYAKETVGLATCIPQKLLAGEVKDKTNYLYTLQASGQNSFKYHIVFTSLKETFGYKTQEEWFTWIQEWKKELENPCTIRLK